MKTRPLAVVLPPRLPSLPRRGGPARSDGGVVIARHISAPPLLALLLAIILIPAISSADLLLAEELLKEKDWAAARSESSQILRKAPANETALFIEAAAQLNLDPSAGVIATLDRLSRKAKDDEVRTRAAYELGSFYWHKGDPDRAWPYLVTAFTQTRSIVVFIKSGCTIHYIIEDKPRFAHLKPELKNQLQSSQHLWSPAVRRECQKAEPPVKDSWFRNLLTTPLYFLPKNSQTIWR